MTTSASSPGNWIRSFVRREGRMTKAQRRALERLWPRYGVEPADGRIDPAGLFAGAGPVALDIGFGHGESLLAMAQRHPDTRYLGIEVYRPGIGSLLLGLEESGLDNVRVACVDVLEVLRQLPPASVSAAYLFFPDPWPKLRHHKRRLVRDAFAQSLARVMRPGARLYLATDWEDYALHMLKVLDAQPELVNVAGAGGFSPRCEERPSTKFERRGESAGHAVRDLCYERSP